MDPFKEFDAFITSDLGLDWKSMRHDSRQIVVLRPGHQDTNRVYGDDPDYLLKFTNETTLFNFYELLVFQPGFSLSEWEQGILEAVIDWGYAHGGKKFVSSYPMWELMKIPNPEKSLRAKLLKRI
jgi:hypothetical protein